MNIILSLTFVNCISLLICRPETANSHYTLSFYSKFTVCEILLAIKRTAALVHDRQRDGSYCTTLSSISNVSITFFLQFEIF